MERTKTTIEEFLKQDIDIDVCDDVEDEFYISFVGPVELTDAGREHFAPVLGLQVFIVEDGDQPSMNLATVHIDGDDWKKRLARVNTLFKAAAGYCSAESYSKWFKE